MYPVDPAAHGVRRKPARVDRPAVLQRAPDERLAEARLAARAVFPRPGSVQELQIDVAGMAVRIEVSARKRGGEERHAELVRRGVELVDVAVLRFAQLPLADHRAEV